MDSFLHYQVTTIDLVKLVLAVALGGAIGMEREVRDKPAGFRTMILICVGSTLFTIFSFRVGGGADQHIAAQVVSGVGFLGAGAILRERGRIQGLTTAAAIWLVASLGIGLGIGSVGTTLAATVVVLMVLLVLSKVETWVDVRRDRRAYRIQVRPDAESIARIQELARGHTLKILHLHVGKEADSVTVHITLQGARDRHEKLGDALLREDVVLRFDSD